MDNGDNNSPFRGLLPAVIIGSAVALLCVIAFTGHAPELSRVQISQCQPYWERNQDCQAFVSPPSRIFLVDWISDNADWLAALVTAIATIYIAMFTRALRRSTDKLWAVSKQQANTADRALTELEAPFISIKIIESGVTKKTNEIGHDFNYLIFSIINYGRSPATLVELADWFKLVEVNSGMPPERPLDSATRTAMPYGVVAPPDGESQRFTNNLPAFMLGPISTEDLPLMTNALFFYGFVRYSTIFHERYRVGFCFKYDVFGERWLLSGNDRYNYCRKEADQSQG